MSTPSYPPAEAETAPGEPSAAAVTFVNTEHFTLQGTRSQTVAESTGRASMFLGAVPGGSMGLSLLATAAGISTPFYALALTLLPTLAFIGLVTFFRVLQTGLEDRNYAIRIARLRSFYFEHAPELEGCIVSVPPERRLTVQGLVSRPWQLFLTVAGMVAVITSVLAGASAAVLVAVVASSLPGAIGAGGAVALMAGAGPARPPAGGWGAADPAPSAPP